MNTRLVKEIILCCYVTFNKSKWKTWDLSRERVELDCVWVTPCWYHRQKQFKLVRLLVCVTNCFLDS